MRKVLFLTAFTLFAIISGALWVQPPPPPTLRIPPHERQYTEKERHDAAVLRAALEDCDARKIGERAVLRCVVEATQ